MFIKSGVIGLMLFFSCVSAHANDDDDKENLNEFQLGKHDQFEQPRKRMKLMHEEDQIRSTLIFEETISTKPDLKKIIKAKRKSKSPVKRKSLAVETVNFTDDAKWQTCFTPQQKCGDFLVSVLNEAKKSIYLQAYVLSSQPIADALVHAHQRNVEIKVLVDNSQLEVPYSKIGFLAANNIAVYADVYATLAHNKVIIIDKNTTITGSYNLSNAADKRNIENLILIKDSNVTRSYLDNFIMRYQECLRYHNENPLGPDLKESPTRLKSISRLSMMPPFDFKSSFQLSSVLFE